MTKHVDRKQIKAPKRSLTEGEFISRTQKHISKVSTGALKVRSNGISTLRNAVSSTLNLIHAACTNVQYDQERTNMRELLSAMNFSVADAIKELKKRGVK